MRWLYCLLAWDENGDGDRDGNLNKHNPQTFLLRLFVCLLLGENANGKENMDMNMDLRKSMQAKKKKRRGG